MKSSSVSRSRRRAVGKTYPERGESGRMGHGFPSDIFDPATQELLEQRALLKRVDTKFVCHQRHLQGFCESLRSEYQAVQSGNTSHAPYRTIYWDTKERKSLIDHHRGRRPRFKVRIRHHLAREMTFLEVKASRSKGKTAKERIDLPFATEDLTHAQLADRLSAHSDIPAADLRPSMWVEFRRMTLVGVHVNERITIDTELVFKDENGEQALPDLAILEVKQRRRDHHSPSMKVLRAKQFTEMSLSKYVTGAQYLWPEIRLNRYKPNLREIHRITRKPEHQTWNS